MRKAGTPNKKTEKTLQTFGFFVAKYSVDPLEVLFMALAGHKRLFKHVPAMTAAEKLSIRLTAAKELLPYGYSKLSTIPTEKQIDPDMRISWQGELFDDDTLNQPSLTEQIEAL